MGSIQRQGRVVVAFWVPGVPGYSRRGDCDLWLGCKSVAAVQPVLVEIGIGDGIREGWPSIAGFFEKSFLVHVHVNTSFNKNVWPQTHLLAHRRIKFGRCMALLAAWPLRVLCVRSSLATAVHISADFHVVSPLWRRPTPRALSSNRTQRARPSL